MKTKKFTTSQLTILGLMAGILFLMAYTPLGYLNIGPLAVTFNVIPVAIWDAGIRCAFESAVPTAAVMTVEETISLIALTPTIRQHPIIML